MSKRRSYSGDWYIPDSELRVPGVVRVKEKKRLITLTIYSKYYVDGGLVSTSITDRVRSNPVVVLGYFDNSPVTLCYCNWIRTRGVSESLYKVTYKINFVLQHAHFKSIDNIVSDKVKLRYPYLASWYDGYFHSYHYHQGEHIDASISTDFVVNENLTISFKNTELDGKFLLQKYRKYLYLNYNSSESFENVRTDSYKFSKLLNLATSQKINFNIIYLLINKSNASNVFDMFVRGEYIKCYIISFVFGDSSHEDKEFIHQNSMIFSAWKVSRDVLNKIVKRWYRTDNPSHLYDYYIDVDFWPKNDSFIISNVMYNNKFLNIMQALESYHYQVSERYNPDNVAFVAARQSVLNKLDRESKIWVKNNLRFPKEYKLQDRLRYLISRYAGVIKYLFGDLKFFDMFAEDAKEYRNKLSHGNLENTYQGDYFHSVFNAAKFLLCLCVMESLGIDEINTINALRYNYKLGDDIYSIESGYLQKTKEIEDGKAIE